MYTVVLPEAARQRIYETALIPEIKPIEMQVINLYPEKTYQTVEGFGGALTEAAGYALAQMGEQVRDQVLASYYGRDGIGYTMGRVSMDSCDFSLGHYCALDDPSDRAFASFSLERDEKYVEPMLQKVNDLTGHSLSLLLSPWSPPAHMKTTGVRNGGGHLRKECYQEYADYIVRYITEYRKRGIRITEMTVQNEPLAVQLWDSCEYSSEEEKDFLKNYLYPALQKNDLADLRLYIWDHNKEHAYERTRDIMDEETAKMVEGVAYHWYSGDHFDTLRMIREDYPQLKLMHSEGCVELSCETGKGADRDVIHAVRYLHDMINDFNSGMNSWIDWNIALNAQGGPNHVDNFCDAPVICDAAAGTVSYKPMFYAIAQFSKYVKPGAVRIGCSKYTEDIEMTAFRNPDGCIAAVLLNRGPVQTAEIRMHGQHARIVLQPDSVSTVLMEE
jgi:glucosylceramidase